MEVKISVVLLGLLQSTQKKNFFSTQKKGCTSERRMQLELKKSVKRGTGTQQMCMAREGKKERHMPICLERVHMGQH